MKGPLEKSLISMDRYNDIDNCIKSLSLAPVLFDTKVLNKGYFSELNYEILCKIFFDTSSHNLIIHPGSKAMLITAIFSGVMCLYIKDFFRNELNILNELRPGDKILYNQSRGVYHGIVELDGEQKIKLEFDNEIKYIRLKYSYMLKPYKGTASTLSSGSSNKQGDIRSTAISEILQIDKDQTKGVTPASILVICERDDAFEMVNLIQIRTDRGIFPLNVIFPMAYYGSLESPYHFAGNAAKLNPVVKFSSKISIARDLVYEDKSIESIIVYGKKLLDASPSELEDILNRSSIQNAAILTEYGQENIESFIDAHPLIHVYAWTEDALISNIKDLYTKTAEDEELCEYAKQQFTMIKNIVNKDIDKIIINSKFDWKLFEECRKALYGLKILLEDNEEKNQFIYKAYGLLNLFERAFFPIMKLERMIQDGIIGCFIPLNEINELQCLGENLIEKIQSNDVEINVRLIISSLEKIRIAIYKENPKFDWVQSYLIEEIQRGNKICVVIPKQYYYDVFMECLTEKGKQFINGCDFVTPARFNIQDNYDTVLCCGVFTGKKFTTFSNPNSLKTMALCYLSEEWLFDYLVRRDAKSINRLNALNSIQCDYEQFNNDIAAGYEETNKRQVEIGQSLDKFISEMSKKIGQEIYIDNNSHTQKVEIIKSLIFESGERAFFTKYFKPYIVDRDRNDVLETSVWDLNPGDELVFAIYEGGAKDIIDDIIERMIQNNEFKRVYENPLQTALYWKKALRDYIERNGLTYKDVSDNLQKIGKGRHAATISGWLNEDSKIVGPREEDAFIAIALLTEDPLMLDDPKRYLTACDEVRALRIRLQKYLGKCIVKSLTGEEKNDFDSLVDSVVGDVTKMAYIYRIEDVIDSQISIPIHLANRPLAI